MPFFLDAHASYHALLPSLAHIRELFHPLLKLQPPRLVHANQPHLETERTCSFYPFFYIIYSPEHIMMGEACAYRQDCAAVRVRVPRLLVHDQRARRQNHGHKLGDFAVRWR